MTSIIVPSVAASGTYLLYTALVYGRRGIVGWSPKSRPAGLDVDPRRWLLQAGIEGVNPGEFVSVVATIFVVGALAAATVFGGLLPAVVTGGFVASIPVAGYRHRRAIRRHHAQEAWPRILEEMRLLTGAVGRSIPQALFEAGGNGPPEMRGAFEAAHREWLLSTDFARTLTVLKQRLGDPTADAVAETLLIAHEVGGADLDRRLEALAADRALDLQGRKDARSRLAGARFARWFVLAVPMGMAAAGASIGRGREAYATPVGQVLVASAILLVAACWMWANRIMAIPGPQRVFGEQDGTDDLRGGPTVGEPT